MRILLAAVLSVVVLSGLATGAYVLAWDGDVCNFYKSGDAPVNGYALPWNPFSAAKTMLITASCSGGAGQPVTHTVGSGEPNQYVYKTGYVYKGDHWEPFTLQGSFVDGSSSWLRGRGVYTYQTPPNTDYFWAGYVCQWQTGTKSWKCGCRDQACATPLWQLQKVTFPKTVPDNPPSIGDAGGNPPPEGGYGDIELLPATSTLPSVSECMARVHRSAWEPRPQNRDENLSTVGLTIAHIDGAMREGAEQTYLERIAAANNARFTGTTDELIQFYSCYWGVDDESTRARAIIESDWNQDAYGDGSASCNGKPISWGLLQVKDGKPQGCESGPHIGTYPDVFVSTGNNLNYSLAWTAACYRGDFAWVPEDFADNPVERMRQCMGLWYSGEWQNGNNLYLSAYDAAFEQKPWRKADFYSITERADCCYDANTCDNLPHD